MAKKCNARTKSGHTTHVCGLAKKHRGKHCCGHVYTHVGRSGKTCRAQWKSNKK